jgi:hypothetical protein
VEVGRIWKEAAVYQSDDNTQREMRAVAWSVNRGKQKVTYREQTKVDMPGGGLAYAPGRVELRVYSTNSVGMEAWRGVSKEFAQSRGGGCCAGGQ